MLARMTTAELTSEEEAPFQFHWFPKINVGGGVAVHAQRDLQVLADETERVPQSVVDLVTCKQQKDAFLKAAPNLFDQSSHI